MIIWTNDFFLTSAPSCCSRLTIKPNLLFNTGTVKRIAEFYGVKLSPKEHKKVVEKCGFPYMKNHTHMFNYQLPLNANSGGTTIMNSGSMTRKGTLGDGKATFTEEGKFPFNT